MQYVGGKCDHKDLCGHPEIYTNRGRFQPRQNEGKAVHRRSIHSAPVCMQTQPSSYILGNKRKRKKADYIFIHQHCCFFCDTTLSVVCLLNLLFKSKNDYCEKCLMIVNSNKSVRKSSGRYKDIQ